MPHNNRRSFFKKFGVLLGAASLSPTLFIPKFEPVKWKRNSIVNPDWKSAPMEIRFILSSALLTSVEMKGYDFEKFPGLDGCDMWVATRKIDYAT